MEEEVVTNSINCRELVLDMLLSINRDGEFSHIVIKNVLDKYAYLDKSERSFIKRLCQGTIENQIRIDSIINQISKTPVHKMKPVIREILRSAVYQLEFMDGVPESAACNEAVKLAKKRKFQNLSGFVNGILRNVVRQNHQFSLPDKEKDRCAYLSTFYSMPEWIVEKWVKDYGDSTTKQILADFLNANRTTIRCNLTKISREDLKNKLEEEGVTVEVIPEVKEALVISNYDSLQRLSSFQNGEFYIQDLSSMKVAEIANPQKDQYIIDMCAAPGGKSLHLAEKLEGTGMVDARDVSWKKVDQILENKKRIGLHNLEAKLQDATILDPESIDLADIVIADVPCSGLGVISKKVDIKYKMTPEKIKEIVILQRQILEVAGTYVKANGFLVYSTCTINREENQENVQWFLQKFPDFECCFEEQILPIDGKQDGFFISKLEKKG